jgi:O-antigen chain-terminating methyltransferase
MAYLPLLESLAGRFPSGKALDLGCGRCEWLELLAEQGLKATGVDLDAGMLADCRERSLNVEQGDAIEVLAAASDDSHALITGFHIAEHLPFDVLMRLVIEAKRVLHPGGVLLLETPNPENIRVATRDFYLDPTHRHPLPPALLGFVYEFAGFDVSATLRLGEPSEIRDKKRLSLHDVFSSVSPDYAVLGCSGRDPSTEQAIRELVHSHSGVDLDEMIARYHRAEEERFASIDGDLRRLESRLETQIDGYLRRLESRLETQKEGFEAELEAVGEQNRELHEQLMNVYASSSWRLTRPYRFLGRLVRQLWERLRSVRSARWVSPDTLLQWLEQHPALKARLIAVAHRLGISSRLRRVYQRLNRRRALNLPPSSPEVLTPRAKRLSERLSDKGEK